MSDPVQYFDVEKLRNFIEAVLQKFNVNAEDSMIVANVLIEAELRGFNCHGLGRFFPLVKRMQNGLIQPNPNIDIQWQTETTGLCDGGNGLGMVVGHKAMQACIKQARRKGAAFLTVKRSNHFGIAGYYSSMALEHNLIGISMTNASPRVVPTGGTTGKLGTNPISVAFPRKQGDPYILDMSTSVVSSGRVDVALRKGEKVPESWIYPSIEPFLNEDGVAPMSVLQLPLGGHKETSGYKGFGLALLVDLLCGVLSGANFGSQLVSSKSQQEEANIGHFFGAIQVAGFRDQTEIFVDLEKLIDDVKDSPLEPDVDKIRIAGEPEAEAQAYHKKVGIPVQPAVREKLQEIGKDLKINYSLFDI